jgi:hypothetical protein
MGLARHKGEVRLGLSATVASAVLYSAVVLFGVGSASPSALDAGGDRHPSVVLFHGKADTVSGSELRLPQASPEPGRRDSRVRPQRPRKAVEPVAAPAATANVESAPTAPIPPRVTESAAPKVTASSAAPPAQPAVAVPLPVVTVPDVTVPTLPLPQLPAPLPELPAPLPELPAPPSLPLQLP